MNQPVNPGPDWADRLRACLHALPNVPAGDQRLFRMQSAQPVAPAAWVAQLQAIDGTQAAAGRWFTADPQALAFYAQELDHPQLLTLDVTSSEAQACQVKNFSMISEDGVRPRAFSRDPENEYFVPRAWLDRCQQWRLPEAPKRRRLTP